MNSNTSQLHKVRIGTRRSLLAKAQSKWVAAQLSKLNPQVETELVEIVTTGDRILQAPLSEVPGKGLFVKEIEEKLLSGEIDLAVHSMKDVPADFPPGLGIGAVAGRVDPRDVLVTRHNKNIEELPAGASIGTSSLRRKAQLRKWRPDLNIVDIRGNIDTRLRKSETTEYDGIILAAAGLLRMGWHDRIQQFLKCDLMVPAVGQGALAIETRNRDAATKQIVSSLNCSKTDRAVTAERLFMEGMGGGCQSPMGAFCRERNGEIIFHAFYAAQDGSKFLHEERVGRLEQVSGFARELVAQFKEELAESANAVEALR